MSGGRERRGQWARVSGEVSEYVLAHLALMNVWGIPEIDSNRSRAPRDQCIFELLPEIGVKMDFYNEISAN